MKALKKVLLLSLIIVATASFNNVIAQTFKAENAQEQTAIGSRYKLILDLLKQEVEDNVAYSEYKEKINEDIEQTLEFGDDNSDCSDYVPLLVEGLKNNTQLAEYYYTQGIYGYKFNKFDNGKPSSVTYNFESIFNEKGSFIKEVYSINIDEGESQKRLDNDEAWIYIKKNFCIPLNEILDQNAGRSISQLLEILRQRFSH